jgi:hypothetical protein
MPTAAILSTGGGLPATGCRAARGLGRMRARAALVRPLSGNPVRSPSATLLCVPVRTRVSNT